MLLLTAASCRRSRFPDIPAGYREFAYVSNGASNTVSVLDLVYLRQDRTLQVGAQPTGIAANPKRDEVYVVNAGSASGNSATGNGSVSVIDTGSNRVAATIPVHKLPYFIDVDAAGQRAYVANSGSNTVSVIDLDQRREIGVVGTGEQPGLARISPDMRTLVVTNRGSGSVSIFAVPPSPAAAAEHVLDKLPEKLQIKPKSGKPAAVQLPRLRAAFSGCPGATEAAKQNPSLLTDHMLTLLDVGQTPVQLVLKPDGGELFCSNFGSNSVSKIETTTNEVAGTYTIATQPVYGVVSADNSMLWVSNFGGDSINIWDIDAGEMAGSVRTGRAPDALAFSADEHLLLAADARSGDIAVIRTVAKDGPTLFTTLPAGGSPNAIAVKAMQGKP
jgi:YVTN family beta-propeller protein